MIRFPSPNEISLGPLPSQDAGGRGQFRINIVLPVCIVIRQRRFLLIRIPVGFVTDGGSIPWYARWRFDPWGRFGLAYVLHDALFYLTDWPKWLIDALFLIALRSQGATAFEATTLYLAARTRPRRKTDVARFA